TSIMCPHLRHFIRTVRPATFSSAIWYFALQFSQRNFIGLFRSPSYCPGCPRVRSNPAGGERFSIVADRVPGSTGFLPRAGKSRELVRNNGLSSIGDELAIDPQVVLGEKSQNEDFAGLEQMPQVGSGIAAPATRASARFVDRGGIVPVLRLLDR